MMVAMLAVSFAMQAQTKFHDVEANDATGPVKSIKSQMMGRDMVINFTQDGKMQREGMSDAKYDANVTGDGTYTVWMETAKAASGAVVFCVDIKNLYNELADPSKVKAEIVNISLDPDLEAEWKKHVPHGAEKGKPGGRRLFGLP